METFSDLEKLIIEEINKPIGRDYCTSIPNAVESLHAIIALIEKGEFVVSKLLFLANRILRKSIFRLTNMNRKCTTCATGWMIPMKKANLWSVIFLAGNPIASRFMGTLRRMAAIRETLLPK